MTYGLKRIAYTAVMNSKYEISITNWLWISAYHHFWIRAQMFSLKVTPRICAKCLKFLYQSKNFEFRCDKSNLSKKFLMLNWQVDNHSKDGFIKFFWKKRRIWLLFIAQTFWSTSTANVSTFESRNIKCVYFAIRMMVSFRMH